jgi:phosphoribosylformylglycinamidine synthase
LAISVGVNPWFTVLDPYRGGASSVDEACRNIVSVGGRPHSLTNCLNFGNPEKPERLGELKEAVAGMADLSKALKLAVPSGNVSLYNEAASGSCLPTVTVMGLGIVEDVRRCVTTDLKRDGNPLYLVGKTKAQFGGSALFRVFGGKGGEVADSDAIMMQRSIEGLNRCMSSEMIRSCHDLSDGGLAVALAEMCIGGDIGAEIDLMCMDPLPNMVSLFSESNTRWVVEVEKGREKEFFSQMPVPITRIGHVGGEDLLLKNDGLVLDQPVSALRERWSRPLWDLLG